MNLKKALKYQCVESKNSLIIFYSIIYTIYIISIISTNISNANGIQSNFGGIETATMIFIFILGLNSFKETFKMFLQNGLSRKTLFISFVFSAIAISAFMAFIDSINGLIASKISTYQSLYMQLYNLRYVNINGLSSILEGFLWSFMAYATFTMIGFFITTLYYRLNKGYKIAVSIGVPVFFTLILPLIESSYTHGAISVLIIKFLTYAFGFNNGYNPYYPIVFFMLVFILFGILSYNLIYKAIIKD